MKPIGFDKLKVGDVFVERNPWGMETTRPHKVKEVVCKADMIDVVGESVETGTEFTWSACTTYMAYAPKVYLVNVEEK